VDVSERRKPISVARVVVVGTTVVVDIAKVSRVAGIRRTLPPVVSRTITNRSLSLYLNSHE
jgi:hypothetical protein